jgi:hypothetical protein
MKTLLQTLSEDLRYYDFGVHGIKAKMWWNQPDFIRFLEDTLIPMGYDVFYSSEYMFLRITKKKVEA